MTMNASPWTAERIEMLRTMAAEGKSCGVIANALIESGFTNCTRNAVLGKAFRDGITVMRFPLVHLSRGGRGTPRRRRLTERQVRIRPKLVPLPFVAPDTVMPLKIPYTELKEHHCRFLLEERGEDGLKLSCGHQVMEGHSWCFGHGCSVYNEFVCYQQAAE